MIGLDIGSQYIKICVPKDGGFLIRSFEVKQTENKGKIIVEKIKDFLRENKIKEKFVSTSINDLQTKILKLELPKLAIRELRNAVIFQAIGLLGLTQKELNNFDYDFFVSEESEDKLTVFLILLHKSIVNNKLEIVSSCGLFTSKVTIDGLSVAGYFLKTNVFSRHQTIVLLNIGAKYTNLILLKKGNIILLKNIMFGGMDFTQRIQKEKNLSFIEAEKIKKDSQKIDNLQMADIIKEIAIEKEFIKVVSSQLAYLIEHKIIFGIDKVVICGGGALTPGLEPFLIDEFGVTVETWNPLGNKKEGIFFPTVLGLVDKVYV